MHGKIPVYKQHLHLRSAIKTEERKKKRKKERKKERKMLHFPVLFDYHIHIHPLAFLSPIPSVSPHTLPLFLHTSKMKIV